MIKAAKELQFQDNTELFEYILDSIINGQRSQARELVASVRRSRATGKLLYWIMEHETLDTYLRELKEMI